MPQKFTVSAIRGESRSWDRPTCLKILELRDGAIRPATAAVTADQESAAAQLLELSAPASQPVTAGPDQGKKGKKRKNSDSQDGALSASDAKPSKRARQGGMANPTGTTCYLNAVVRYSVEDATMGEVLDTVR